MSKLLPYRQLSIILLGLATTCLFACSRVEPTFTPTTGSIFVTSNPAGADIILDGIPSGLVTPDTLAGVPQGAHTIKVYLDKHSATPESMLVTVTAGSSQDASFILSENPGSISVTTVPEDSATIWLDGNDTGNTTPHTLTGLASGDYVVRVVKTGFTTDPESLVVNVLPDETTAAPFTLIPPVIGELIITSDPSGANIFIDGADWQKTTPDTLELEPATYEVTVALPGYEPDPISQNVTIQEDQTTTAHFDMVLQVGHVYVTSSPSGAAIILDSTATGTTTPDTLRGLTLGDHVVKVALQGFIADPESLTVAIAVGQTTNADFGFSAQKVVLLEAFSNVSCIGCPQMNETNHTLMTTPGYGRDKLLLIKFSMNWPDQLDPHYQANPTDNLARGQFYQDYLNFGIPTLAGDGFLLGASGSPPPLIDLTAWVDTRLTDLPAFAIGVAHTVVGTSVEATITLSSTAAVDLTGYSLNVVLVESLIIYDTPPGNQGELEFHWVMRDFETASSSVGVLSVDNPLEFPQSLTRTLSMPAENLYVIAFVQNNTTREILQAGSDAVGAHAARVIYSAPHWPSHPSTPRSGG